MDNDVESQMKNFMQPLFGDMAQQTIENQKAKLKLEGEELSKDDYIMIADSIKDLCMKMAGKAIADKIYNGLMEIIESK